MIYQPRWAGSAPSSAGCRGLWRPRAAAFWWWADCFYAAILMLKGGNLPQDAFTLRPWKKQRPAEFDEVEPLRLFRVLPRQGSFLLISIGILVTSLIPEGIVLHYL